MTAAEKAGKTLPPKGVTRQLLRIATAGSVDDGKSTLIGRLLHDTDSLPLDHLEAVTDEEGVADLAALSDGLRAEREQGITIDVAYRFFSTDTRSYILADTPGHERYTRNMFTGASNAHVAILLVDARAGVLRQTRRHARIAKLLGIKHFVATVNKIDLIDFDQAGFAEVEDELRQTAARLGDVDITVIPIAAKHGDNVVHRSERTPWYRGPTLLEYLEGVELAAPQAEASRLRLPVQWVSRPTADVRRRYTGRLAAGTLSVGDPVVSLPAGTRSTVTALDTLDDDRTTAVAPLSVSIELADDIDVGRGDVFVSGADDAVLPVLARELDATVCWFVDSPLRAGDRLALKQTTKTVRATVQELHSRLDPETLDELDGPVELVLNDIGTVTLRTSSIIIADRLRRQPRQRRLHPDRRIHQRHRRCRHHHRGTGGQAGHASAHRYPLASVSTGPWPPVAGHRTVGRDDLVHRPARIRQVDHRGRCGARTGRIGTGGLPARRRQLAPRPVRRPGLLPRRPH